MNRSTIRCLQNREKTNVAQVLLVAPEVFAHAGTALEHLEQPCSVDFRNEEVVLEVTWLYLGGQRVFSLEDVFNERC